MTGVNTPVEVPVSDDPGIGLELPTITDQFMSQRLSSAQNYTLWLLRRTPKLNRPQADPIVWEHGRRNMALQEAGLMPVVCPVTGAGEWAGIGILTVGPERAAEIFSEDPGVKAGIFTFEVHPVVGFPGSTRPGKTLATQDRR